MIDRPDQTVLLDREQELETLVRAWETAQAGDGQVVLVQGAAGVGKSALMASALRHGVSHAEGTVLRARGSEPEREFAFDTVRQLLAPVLARLSDGDRAETLAGAAAPAAWILAPTDADRSDSGFAVMHAIYWVISNLAARQPLLLKVDDLHWVDPPSLRALNYVAGRVTDLSVMICAALRPQEPGSPTGLIDELRQLPAAAMLQLGALAPEAVTRLICRTRTRS